MRALFFILIGLLAAGMASAQSSYDDQNTVAVPSANNDMLKVQDFSVSLYTGVPQINIPLYTLPTRVQGIPVSLLYTGAGGIRVQDVSGYAGLGWMMNAGGSISRVLRGLPDECDSGYIGSSLTGQKIAAGVNSTLLNQIGGGQYDGEPDLFTVTTPFFSFQFQFDQNGKPVFPNNTGLKFSDNLYNNSGYQSGTWWIVTDADGNQFYFGSTNNSREYMTTDILNQKEHFLSTWYLDKIVFFNSKDVVNLTYTVGSDYSVNHYMATQTTFVSSPTCTAPGTISSNYTETFTYNGPKYINTISSSQGQVVFNYLFDRQDFANDGRLTSIVISSTANTSNPSPVLVKSYQFNYSYFGSGTADAMRLCLNSIQLYGSGTDAPLTFKSFDYNTTANLPPRNDVEFDWLGYYNTNSTGTSLVPTANKTPDPSRITANMLVAVHDLSGEVDHMNYQINTYYDNISSSNLNADGVRIGSVSKVSPSGETLTTTYNYNDASGRSTGQLYAAVGPDGTVYNQAYRNFQRTINLLILGGNGGGCGISGNNISSESIFSAYGLNGNFVGYSSVQIFPPSGGYEIDTFTNFSDFPDTYVPSTSNGTVYAFQNAKQISAATSAAYKRGLLLSKTVYTATNARVSRVKNVYSSLDALSSMAMGVRLLPFTFIDGAGITVWLYGTYNADVENYMLTQTVNSIYDQASPTNWREINTTYTYAANHRLVRETDYLDSRQLPRSKINYYTEDNGIPLLTGDEQIAVNNLLSANNVNAVIHSVEVRNGSTVNTHSSYLSFIDAGMNTKVYLARKKTYLNNNTDGIVQQYQYDPGSGNLIAVNKLGGPFLSTLYGYNQTCMTAKVKNALRATSTSVGQGNGNGQIAFQAGQLGGSITQTFHIDYPGTVVLTANYQGPTGPGVWINTLGFELSANDGSYSAGNTVCVSNNNSCSFSPSFSTPQLNPGTYTLTVTPQGPNNTLAANPYVNYTYPQFYTTQPAMNEFFYEGFEELSTAATSTPCAGLRYNAGAYTVPFVMPNTRQYQVDYHYLSGGVWYPMTKPYTNNMVLSDGSGIDEVRVYPTDAQMVTYTYNPLVGLTSQCDERNRFTFYDYDGFGRLLDSKDNDHNLLKVYNYQYQVTPQ